MCVCVVMHYLLCVCRFPEAEADQKWIYRHAPEEIERPYRVDEGEREAHRRAGGHYSYVCVRGAGEWGFERLGGGRLGWV